MAKFPSLPAGQPGSGLLPPRVHKPMCTMSDTGHPCAQIVQQDFKITDSYTAPKGTLIMPSITAATMQVLAARRC